jgi:ubiquinone/menaquinone biosynthesis C-methylase UbiE
MTTLELQRDVATIATELTDFRVADMHALPFEDGRFNAVIAESVICFSSEKEGVLAEMIRVVKPEINTVVLTSVITCARSSVF